MVIRLSFYDWMWQKTQNGSKEVGKNESTKSSKSKCDVLFL